MEKVTPMRTCTGCRQIRNKKDMVRVVKKDNDYRVDFDFKCEGRGAYVCRNEACIDRAISKGGLERSFRCGIPKEVAGSIREELLKGVKSET